MRKLLVVAILLVGVLAPAVQSQPAQAQAVYMEGRDYATEILHDAWDMSEFSDVSHRLNGFNQFDASTIQVQNGVFSATTRSSNEGSFFPLYPGFEDAMNTRKPGTLYPMSSSTYRCLYAAIKMPNAPGGTYVKWSRGKPFNPLGWTNTAAYPDGAWALRKADLTTTVSGQAWTSQALWEALVVVGSMWSGSAQSFEVDWIRLTDCAAVNHSVTWTGTNPATVYLRPQGTTREIHVAGGLTGGSYTLDLQGVPPGTYDVIARMSGQADQVTQVEIMAAPIADFVRPSMLSGEDFASAVGNPWDFSDTTDIENIGVQAVYCLTWSVSGGVLHLDTAPPSQQPANCKDGSGIADPRVYLNMPVPITTLSDYRYLSFRMHTGNADWPVQTVPNGMIVRWIWAQDMSPWDPCYQVTEDIPYDIGWWTTSVDMHDGFNGLAEQAAKGTGGDPITCDPMRWDVTQPQIIRMRFDPNENWTGTGFNEYWVPAFHFIQQLDWIRLTKVDRTAQGSAFPVRLSLNKPAAGLTFSFYYTTTRDDPTQNLALEAGPVVPSGPNLLYLPLVLRNPFNNDWYLDPVSNGYTFMWDTTGVAPGEYFVCVEVHEGGRSTRSCSEAPVQVAGP